MGGSAFEWHFPTLHALEDLDIVIQATSQAPYRAFEQVMTQLGFQKSGKTWASLEVIFTVELVGSSLALAPKGIGSDTEIAHALTSGRPFRVSTATMMWCDRALAWEALPESQRDARHTLQALLQFPNRIQPDKARRVLRAAGILGILKRRVESIPEWKDDKKIFR